MESIELRYPASSCSIYGNPWRRCLVYTRPAMDEKGLAVINADGQPVLEQIAAGYGVKADGRLAEESPFLASVVLASGADLSETWNRLVGLS